MKSLVVAAVLFACVLMGSLLSTKHIDNISEKMLEQNKAIMEMIQQADFDGAEGGAEELEGYVHEKRVALSTTMDHVSINTIEINLAELQEYIKGEKKEDALAKSEVLNSLFEHLPQNYELKLGNIL